MVEIQEISPNQLDVYLKIPIFFTVSSIMQIELLQNGLGGILFKEEPVGNPYIKDYGSRSRHSVLKYMFFAAKIIITVRYVVMKLSEKHPYQEGYEKCLS